MSLARSIDVLRRHSVTVVAVLAVMALGLGQALNGGSVLRKLGLVTAKTPTTALYFSDSAKLPDIWVTGSSMPLHFVVQNGGDEPESYMYKVATDAERGIGSSASVASPGPTSSSGAELQPVRPARIVQSGTVVIPAGAQRTVAVDVVILACIGRQKIAVSLAPTAEAIHLYVQRRALSGENVPSCG